MKKIFVLLATSMFLSSAFAADAPTLAGTWKAVDDKTGFSRADIEVVQNSDGSYSGKIIRIRPLPDKPLVETCLKCKGNLKDKPFVGMQIMSGFKKNPNDDFEYTGGKVLDPLSGNIYSGKAKLNPRGSRITLRGYVGVSMLGRSATWIRIAN